MFLLVDFSPDLADRQDRADQSVRDQPGQQGQGRRFPQGRRHRRRRRSSRRGRLDRRNRPATGAKVVNRLRILHFLFGARKVPVEQVLRSGPGDWNKIGDIAIRNVGSIHGSGTADKPYGGAAMGFMIKFENGLTVYFAGSTAPTLDMTMWGRMYKPDVAILQMSAGKDPQDLVEEIRMLRTGNPNLKTIIPHHHRLQVPPGGTTPADVAAAVKAAKLPVTVLIPDLGKSYNLGK